MISILDKIKENLSWKGIKRLGISLSKKCRVAFLFLIIVLTGYCVYLWYGYVYHSEWDEGRKKSYADTRGKDVTLNKSKFDGLVSEREKRSARYQENLSDIPDIFRLEQ